MVDFQAVPSTSLPDRVALIPQHSIAQNFLDDYSLLHGLPRLREDATVMDREEYGEFLDAAFETGLLVDEETDPNPAEQVEGGLLMPF